MATETDSLFDKGNDLRKQGDFHGASKAFLEFARLCEDPEEKAEALRHAEECVILSTKKRIKDSFSILAQKQSLALDLIKHGRLAEAAELYLQLAELMASVGLAVLSANEFLDMSSELFGNEIDYFTNCFLAATKNAAIFKFEAAGLFSSLGKHCEAAIAFLDSEELRISLNDSSPQAEEWLANTLLKAGDAYYSLKLWEEAAELLLESSFIFRRIKSPTYATAMGHLGNCYQRLGQLKEAYKAYIAGTEFVQDDIRYGCVYAEMLEHAGNMLYLRGKRALAVQLWEKAQYVYYDYSKIDESFDYRANEAVNRLVNNIASFNTNETRKAVAGALGQMGSVADVATGTISFSPLECALDLFERVKEQYENRDDA